MPSFVEDGVNSCCNYCGHFGGCHTGRSVDNTGAEDTEIGNELGMGISVEVAISAADRQRRSGARPIAIAAAREFGGEYLMRTIFYSKSVHPSLNNMEKTVTNTVVLAEIQPELTGGIIATSSPSWITAPSSPSVGMST